MTVPPMGYDEFKILSAVPETGRPFRIGNGQLAGLTRRSEFFEMENKDLLQAILVEIGPGEIMGKILNYALRQRAARGIPFPEFSKDRQKLYSELGI